MARYPFTSALVTGASSGIGAEFTRLLRAAGVPVVVVARRTHRLAALASELGGIEVLPADLSTDDGQRRVAERIAAGDDPIDLVVNNAGFGTGGPFHALDADRLADEIAVNCSAVTRLSHAAAATMVPRRRGWLLNVSSVASFQPAPRFAVYAATKAFVTSLTESLHEELAPLGVHVTAVCPGLTPTEFKSGAGRRGYQERLPNFVWTSATSVASTALADVVRNRALSVPGPLYKVAVAGASVTPRFLLRKASAMVQRG